MRRPRRVWRGCEVGSSSRSLSRQQAAVIAGLLIAALACASRHSVESAQPATSCRLDDRDRRVLQTVLEEVVLGSGACAEPGLMLIYELTVSPEFPETLEEARRWREIDARLAAGEEIDEEELLAAPPTAEATGLEFSNGMTLDQTTVRSARDRQACQVGELEAPAGWSLSRLEVRVHEDLFARDIPKGWKRLRELFPGMECLVKFSAPGYVEYSDQAFVSFSRMRGPLGGMGGFVVLRRKGGQWRIEWQEGLWVS